MEDAMKQAIPGGRRHQADVFTCVRPCRAVSVRLVGSLSAILPIRQEIAAQPKCESADLQESCGAPGWNRTSDTRFRKPKEGVIGGSAECANVLHSPRFCATSMLGRIQAWWAVVRRLVGISSAAPAPFTETSAGFDDPSSRLAPEGESG